jgi:hypothetical protein
MPECSPYNLTQRVCDLEEAISQILDNEGHPPMEVTFGSDPNSFDEPTQVLNINVPTPPVIPDPEVVVAADDTARGLLAPTKLNQLMVQQTDATNGNFSLWKANALSAGAWTLIGASMAKQNANAVAITGGTITGITDLAVADGGTGASSAAGARVNLTIPSDGPVGVDFDWSLRSHFWELIAANTNFTFSNVIDGASIMVSIHSVGSAYTVGWPASVRWSGGTPPVHSGADRIDVYAFTVINSIIFGSVVADYPDS